MVDIDVAASPSGNDIHYLVVNVPGTDAASGDVIHSYVPPFTVDYNPNRVPAFDPDSDFEHKIVFLVYQQQDEITGAPLETEFCPRVLTRLQVTNITMIAVSLI